MHLNVVVETDRRYWIVLNFKVVISVALAGVGRLAISFLIQLSLDLSNVVLRDDSVRRAYIVNHVWHCIDSEFIGVLLRRKVGHWILSFTLGLPDISLDCLTLARHDILDVAIRVDIELVEHFTSHRPLRWSEWHYLFGVLRKILLLHLIVPFIITQSIIITFKVLFLSQR